MPRCILRFDDLCPTMNWVVWDQIEALLDRHGVHPLLGIVPDNQDAKLMVGPPNPDFWRRAREWQAKGWVIGLHGYRHVYDSKVKGLVPWWPQSEFAGVSYQVQDSRIQNGLRILREQELVPRVWIAPAHSFDQNTLEILKARGLSTISDGWGWRPYRCRRGMVWVPAQPWKPPFWKWGVWTLVFHHNNLRNLHPIEDLVRVLRPQSMGVAFTFDALLVAGQKTLWDTAFERLYGIVFSVLRFPQGLKRKIRRRRGENPCR